MWGRLVESGKSHSTHTPSWVPLLFLPPWRRGPWHDFLSLVSIIESHSLFSGQSSRSKAAWIQNVCPPPPRCYEAWRAYTSTQKLTEDKEVLKAAWFFKVTFWLQWFIAFSSIAFKACFLSVSEEWEQIGWQAAGSPWVKPIDYKATKCYKYPACQYL